MKTFTTSFVIAVCLFMATSLLAEVIRWQQCPNDNPEARINCTVHEVRVDPCREAASERPCRLKRGRKASISFDYTPHFSGENLTAEAYWPSDMGDLPFLGMENNACNYTTCPVVSDSRQTYSYDLKISKSFPSRNYDVKWMLWHKKETACCFLFQIKLYK